MPTCDDWALTDERLAKLAETSKSIPCAETAFCPDATSRFRFEMHIVADKLITGLIDARAEIERLRKLCGEACDLAARVGKCDPEICDCAGRLAAIRLAAEVEGKEQP